ncbi:MAG: histidine kinase [bacterium]|nr:MAG: histidine kinase [bacterium]
MARRAKAGAEAEAPEQQFLRLMSHEMRTPLNGVIGMLGLLSRTRLDGAQRAYAEAARSSAEHLLGLVNDLLDYARLEAGKLEFDHAPVDLEALVRGVAELLSPRAHEKGLEIAWSVAPGAVDVMGDEGRLRQVLFNLAGNAVKFTETGGVRIAVERTGGSAKAPRLAFIIDDTGPGVPAEARTRIFEEFGHVDASDASRFGGAGLGLAVVSKLAAAMQGAVSVGDRPDGPGARFRFEAIFEAATGVPERGAPLTGHAVSVVSPDPFVRAAAVDQIEASGGTVREDAGIVLIDHAARDTGHGLARRPGDGRAIVLLKPAERDLIARYRGAGFHGYLIKPLRRASLAERVLAASGAGHGCQPGLPPPPPPEDDRVAPTRFSGTRVLLVEDNPVGALLAATLLRREGCAVETAASGHEAVDAMKRARYDLVFMDMRMPGMDGPSAARAIRAVGDRTPIVALTANAFAEDLRAALARWTNRTDRAKVAAG